MKFSIITPCFQAEKYIKETVLSILGQTALLKGDIELEYLIQDGGSSDQTIPIINALNSPCIQLESSRDQGMYDALARGLQRSSGDIIAYLNAGDLYTPHTFEIVAQIFQLPRKIGWLSGLQVAYNERSHFVASQLPCIYRSELFRYGLYDGRYHPFLQQEVTFWKRDLLQSVDFEKLKSFRLAGDYYLWYCFSQVADLTLIEAHLGGFKVHAGQLSSQRSKYLDELQALTQKPSPLHLAQVMADRMSMYLPSKLKKKINPTHYLCYDHALQTWR